MRKIAIIILVLGCLCTNQAKAQFLNQSADGKSTIPLPLAGLGLGIDIGKAEIDIGLNNYGKVLRNPDNNNNLFVGLNLAVKNSSGLGNLFSSGDIVPSGDFLGFLGYTFSNNAEMLRKWKKSAFVTDNDYYENFVKKKIFNAYLSEIGDALRASLDKIKDNELAARVSSTITEKIKGKGDYTAVKTALASAKTELVKDDELKDFWSRFNELVAEARIKAQGAYNNIFTAERKKQLMLDYNATIRSISPWRISPFLIGGISARSFSLFTKVDPVNLANSFKDTLYRGGTFGVGINAQFRNIWLGITYSYLNGDNFSQLTSKEYTLRTTDTTGNQTLSREKKTTAYSGKYAKVETNQLNADLVWDVKINDSSRLLVNGYLRNSMYSRDTAYIKNFTNIGLGLYFLGKKSKFLGGIYIELPDVNNNVVKAKPIVDRDIQSPLKKLTFGIVTKISLSSILTFQNRPRTPD
jgi:hypothetical protein